LGAIKFYYRNVAKSNQKIEIASAEEPKGLPVVLSRSKVEKILLSVKNYKHKLLLSLSCGAGLRLSESIAGKGNLKPLREYLMEQGRFKNLTEEQINELQDWVNTRWKRCLDRAGNNQS